MAAVAFVREVPDSFGAAVAATPPVPPLDPGMARLQHRAYRDALAAGGYEVRVIPADGAHPDCPFVEDAAVVVAGRAVATRPGHPSREGEVPAVAAALAGVMAVTHLPAPAHLDGGDVFSAGGTVYAGLSGRSDLAGVRALARAAAPVPVVAVPVTGVLHLRTAANPLDEETLLVEPGRVDPGAFAGLRVLASDPGEPHGANVVRLADGRILVAAAAPRSAELVRRAGFELVEVDVSEFARADGGLTCLSVRIRTR